MKEKLPEAGKWPRETIKSVFKDPYPKNPMENNKKQHLDTRIAALEKGYSKVRYLGKVYGVSKSVFNEGKSVKVYAEALGNTDFISFNYYKTLSKNTLKPCEMPKTKVLDFLKAYEKL